MRIQSCQREARHGPCERNPSLQRCLGRHCRSSSIGPRRTAVVSVAANRSGTNCRAAPSLPNFCSIESPILRCRPSTRKKRFDVVARVAAVPVAQARTRHANPSPPISSALWIRRAAAHRHSIVVLLNAAPVAFVPIGDLATRPACTFDNSASPTRNRRIDRGRARNRKVPRWFTRSSAPATNDAVLHNTASPARPCVVLPHGGEVRKCPALQALGLEEGSESKPTRRHLFHQGGDFDQCKRTRRQEGQQRNG